MAERRGTKALELWCRRMVEGYPGVKIDNMTTSWRNGMAFCAIIHHFRPELLDFSKLNKDDIYHNNDLAFTVAEKHLGIPALLEPEDMVEYEVPDRLSILTYLAQFYRAFSAPQGSTPSRIVPKRPAVTSERGIVSPSSTSPPTKMINRTGGIQRRDPCSKCGLPVFIAERLNVGKELFHRTCFRCARCNSQLSLANYYETDSNQFCCETCPDEDTTESLSNVPKFLHSKSLSDEEKSASLEKKQVSDSYSSMFESALENLNDEALKKDSTLSNRFTSARSQFLTMQVEDNSLSTTGNEVNMDLPELPKTKPPDLKTSEITKDNKNNNSVISANVKDNDRDSDLKSIVHRTRNSDQLVAASSSNSYRVNIIVTKDKLISSDKPTSVRDRMKLFETTSSENKATKPPMKEIKKFSDINTSSPICGSSNMSATIRKLSLSPIEAETSIDPKIKDTSETEPTFEETKSPAGPKLNTLLQKQILKKSRTSPSLPDLSTKGINVESTRLMHQSVEDLSKTHQRKFIEETKDVSPLNDKLVDHGVIDSAPTVFSIETHSTTVDDPVSELVEKDNSQILGDGDLSLKATEETGIISRSDDSVDIIDTSNSVIEIDEDTSTDNSRKYPSQTESDCVVVESLPAVIEISDETTSVIEISDSKTEDYPEDLNPFGDDPENISSPRKSLNPFDEDEDENLQQEEEQVIQKPIPTARRNTPPREEKSLNPFDEDTEEENQVEADVPSVPVKKKIPAQPFQTEDDTPEMLSPNLYKKLPVKKVIAAPRISLNLGWLDVDDDNGDEEGGKVKTPVPKPRKMRHSTEQCTPELKLKDQQKSSIFGSNSSLSSANSGGQSVRKKKPAPRPPMLSPDKQESAQSSLTSSPSTSAQHSPRLSASKNRKNKRAPPPPTFTPKNIFVKSEAQAEDLSFIEQQNLSRNEWDKEKDIKDEENRNRQSLIFSNPTDVSDIPRQSQSIYIPNKSTYGQWKKKKGPAPSRPIPQKRTIKQLPIPEIKKELDLIELQQQGLEKQGVRLEQIIRERCEGPDVDPNEVEPIDVDDLILQLFEVVNEKNELCRRQAELMYLKRQQRLEEEHADVEYQIRCLMMQPEANKTDSDKAREEELIARLIEIVERRNEIIECLEIDRLREHDEDASISNSLNTYVAKRDDTAAPISEEESGDKKDKKKKKKLKLKFSKKTDLDKDIDESESSSLSSNKEKKKKKFALF